MGCILSIIGLTLTILTHAGLRKLRATVPSQLLVNLCVALLIAMILFILASHAQGSTTQCRVWAVGLHYFFLAALGWMVVQGINLHAVIVVVLGLDLEKRLKVYYSAAWGEQFFVSPLLSRTSNDNSSLFSHTHLISFHSGIPFLIVLITVLSAGPSAYGGATL